MLYEKNKNVVSRWVDFENPKGAKGVAAFENGCAKGHAFDKIPARSTVTLLDVQGSGVIRRIWMTLSDLTPETLRALVLRMYWDHSGKPAVDCPLGDFFGFSLAKMATYESELFSSPEGRSFNCFIPMPFFEAAKVEIVNESTKNVDRLFYDIDFTYESLDKENTMYFHAWWNRELRTELYKDYTALPTIHGSGRLLGVNVGILTSPEYGDSWYGEGEVKIYLDGDSGQPTIAGTGIEDYTGTAWGMGVYSNRTQGCLEAEAVKGRWSFYRWHTVDPIWFSSDISVRIQQIGGATKEPILLFQKNNARMHIVSRDDEHGFVRLFDKENPFILSENEVCEKDTWYNFYREDDYCSVAYLYLDKPDSELPTVQSIDIRQAKIKDGNP